MNDLLHLQRLAYKSERSASLRLAERTGLSHEQALRQTLELRAGAAGLETLLEQRQHHIEASERRAALRRSARQAARARREARHSGAPTAWRAWFDGSAHPNPGRCAIGGVLKGPAGEVIEISRPAGYGNSSEAEYRALIALLEAAVRNRSHQLTIYGDSKVVVDDVTGPEQGSAPSLLAYRQAARVLLAQLSEVTLRWIPRHKNGEADGLSQRAAASGSLAVCG